MTHPIVLKLLKTDGLTPVGFIEINGPDVRLTSPSGVCESMSNIFRDMAEEARFSMRAAKDADEAARIALLYLPKYLSGPFNGQPFYKPIPFGPTWRATGRANLHRCPRCGRDDHLSCDD